MTTGPSGSLANGLSTETIEPGRVLPELLKLNAIRVSYLAEIKPKSKPSVNTLTEPVTSINSIDISPDGEFLAAATGDNTIAVFDLNDPRKKHVNYVHKYGAGNIRFLPTKFQAVTTSTKTNDDLRLVSFEKPAQPGYFRYFKGHNSPVGSLDVTEDGRNIISAGSIEKKCFLWDVNQETPIASLHVSKRDGTRFKEWPEGFFDSVKPRTLLSPQPVVAFDPHSMIFGVAFRDDPDYVKLYDLRNYSKGPFLSATIDITDHLIDKYPTETTVEGKMKLITAIGADYTQMKFSLDGRTLLVNTNGPYFYLLDSITLRVKKAICRDHRLYQNTFPSGNAPEVSFAQDMEHVIGGNGSNTDPRIYVWNIKSGKMVGIINKDVGVVEANHSLAINYVKHAPNQLLIASAGGHRVSFYKPSTPAVQNIFGK